MRFNLCLVSLALISLVGCGGSDDDDDGTGPTNTLASVTVTAPTVSVAAGARQSITPQGIGTNGQAMAGVSFTYSSGSPNVAFVSATGTILGLTTGTSAITVTGTASGVSKTTTVNVTVSGTLASAASVVAGASSNDFTPNLVAVARGGTVSWTFPGITHNVRFAAATGAPANIPDTQNSNTPISRTFATAGTFNYDCSLHAGMTATVVVP